MLTFLFISILFALLLTILLSSIILDTLPHPNNDKKDYYKYQKEYAEIFLTAKEFINLNYLAPDICSYRKDRKDNIYYLFYQKGDSQIVIGIKSYKDFIEVNRYIENQELNKGQEKDNQLKLELIKAVRNNVAEQRKDIINSMKSSIDEEIKL